MTVLNIHNDQCARNTDERAHYVERANDQLKISEITRRVFTESELASLDDTTRSQAWDNLSWIREVPYAQFPLSSRADRYYVMRCKNDDFHKRLINLLIVCGARASRLAETTVLIQGTMDVDSWEKDVRLVNAIELAYTDRYEEIFQKVRVALDLNDYALSVIEKIREIAPRFEANYSIKRIGLGFDHEIVVQLFDENNGNQAEILMNVDTAGIVNAQFRGIREGLPTTACTYNIKFMNFQNIAEWFMAWYKAEKIDEDITAYKLAALEELVNDFNDLVLATPLVTLAKVVLTVEHNYSNEVDVRANYTGLGVDNNQDCDVNDAIVREFARIEYGEDTRYDCFLKIFLAYYAVVHQDGLRIGEDQDTKAFVNSRGMERLLGEIVLDMISRQYKIPVASVDFGFSHSYMDRLYLCKNGQEVSHHISRDDFTKVFKDSNGLLTDEIRMHYANLVSKFVNALMK
jgi:hypothetical protein